MKSVIWMGTARRICEPFRTRRGARLGINWSMFRKVLPPDNWKPIPAVGPGVREIRVRESSGAFRCIYLATRPEGLYVLHCFQKKTQKTSQQDLDLARRRFRSVRVKP
jgi:phage-related protein